MGRKDGDAWLDRMEKEQPAAEKVLDPGDAFQPHHGDETDLNTLTADLLADPDPSFDPFRQKDASAAAPPAEAAAPADQPPTGRKSLSDLVTHAYAASAPEQARWRSSVAHAVDATYGDPDPDVVVKSTRGLIDTVYRQGAGSEDLAAAEGQPGAGRDAS